MHSGVCNLGQVQEGARLPPHAPQASGPGEEQAHSGYADPEEALLHGELNSCY